MKLAIFGATGKTGLEVVKQALKQGHTVTAFVRNPDRITITDENLAVVIGDALNPQDVILAVEGQDAVICTLGSGKELKKTMIRANGTAHIINAMTQHKIARLIVMTAMGVGESWNDLSLLNKFFFAVLMKSVREDHETQEASVKDSDLDWTIIRPSGLTDTPYTGVYNVGENAKAKTSKIPRADVADLILQQLEKKEFIYKAVTITN